MAYPAGHRDKIRRKIVQSARRLFNRRGFENVSIARSWPMPASHAGDFTAIS
jgi:hypothetical protein